MPSWENTPAIERTCMVCSETFSAKRDSAKYCSPLCANRSRPTRTQLTSEQRRKWREARLQQPGYRERVNTTANENRKMVRKWVSDFKMRSGCIDCGYSAHPAALDIDHMEGKTSHIHKLKSIEAIQAEIERHQCVVRCANCHRIKSFDSKTWLIHSTDS